jgi:hypothetical protein
VIILISRFTKTPHPENIKDTVWRREMLALPPEETQGGYPWWQRIGFWFSVLTLVFTLIYIYFW